VFRLNTGWDFLRLLGRSSIFFFIFPFFSFVFGVLAANSIGMVLFLAGIGNTPFTFSGF
jgi:hypothetical protein